jgi:Lhr-like helicase
LAYDIEKNLRGPIAGMSLEEEWRIHLRTGDTTSTSRKKFQEQGAEFLVTTPESLAVMLAQTRYTRQPRQPPGRTRRRKQLGWSSEVLFRVLEQHEPDHPLLVEAYRQATHTFLDADEAYRLLDAAENVDWKFRELRSVSPFSFPIYASVIKESMMLEDPTIAIERIYHEMYGQLKSFERDRTT